MKEYNPFDVQGRVEDLELARKAAEAQDRWMDPSKNGNIVPKGIFESRNSVKERQRREGEIDANKTIDREVHEKNRELSEAEWEKNYKNTTNLTFEFSGHSPIDSFIEFGLGDQIRKTSIRDLHKKGLITTSQIFEIFEVGIEGNEPVFTGKLKDGWKEKLEGILGKKISLYGEEE